MRIFVTSRTRLGLVGEELIDVAPLEPVMGVEFLQSRRASQSDYESADLIELVRLLDGLPLALELVAPLLRMVTPTQLVERLRNSGNASALQSEFRPLTGLVEGAIVQLDQPQQRLLRVLAQLPRGATLEMVEVFLSYLDAGLGTLRELVDRSLVSSFDDGKQGRRLRVMWAVRSLVSSAGPDESGWGSDDARAILARHACSFGVVEDRWALFHESNVHLRESMRAELGQAHVWIDALTATGDDESAVRCALAFSQLTLWSGSSRQAAQILVSTAGKIDDMAFEQWIWSAAATIAAEAQEWDDADLFLSHGRELANPSQEGKKARQAYAELVACRQRGDFHEIARWIGQLEAFEDNNDLAPIVCRALLVYSNSLFFQNETDEAVALREKAIAASKESNLSYEWIAIYNLDAFNSFLLGQFEEAAYYAYRRGIRVARRFGDEKSIAALERKLSLCLMNLGDFGGAHRARKRGDSAH